MWKLALRLLSLVFGYFCFHQFPVIVVKGLDINGKHLQGINLKGNLSCYKNNIFQAHNLVSFF